MCLYDAYLDKPFKIALEIPTQVANLEFVKK